MEEKDTLEYESLEAGVEEASEIADSVEESAESTVEPSSEITDSQEDVSVDASSESESEESEEEFESEFIESESSSEYLDPETIESDNDDLQYIIQQLDALAEEDASEVSALDDVYQLYDSYDAFMESPVYVTRYELELLNRLEFIQYALCILIALIFLCIFRRK